MIKTERARKYKSTSMLLPVVKMIFPIWATLQLFYTCCLSFWVDTIRLNCQFLNYMFRLQTPCLGISWETTDYILRFSSSLIKDMPQRSHIREGCFPLHYYNLRRTSKTSREGSQDAPGDKKPISVLECILLSRAHPYFFLITKHRATQRIFSYDQNN